jgi:type IV secretory pathway VirD2 relaxase
VMRQMEEDLGTRLDWVAVDHFNTGHPHSHVVVRGCGCSVNARFSAVRV